LEYSGVDTVSPLDATSTATGNSATSMTIVAQQLDEKLATWRPKPPLEVAQMVSVLIESVGPL
jgi:hypothetical protein